MRKVKLTQFKKESVTFIETMKVKDGVVCDVYSYINDQSKDLGIVTVSSGKKTPLQRILKGDRTVEGLMSGKGLLTVTKVDGSIIKYVVDSNSDIQEVVVKVGELMQWENMSNDDLVFYEICYPPYQDGRYENLTE